MLFILNAERGVSPWLKTKTRTEMKAKTITNSRTNRNSRTSRKISRKARTDDNI